MLDGSQETATHTTVFFVFGTGYTFNYCKGTYWFASKFVGKGNVTERQNIFLEMFGRTRQSGIGDETRVLKLHMVVVKFGWTVKGRRQQNTTTECVPGSANCLPWTRSRTERSFPLFAVDESGG
jgi:hypothetical protein